MPASKYKGITLRNETINRLDSIRHQGQSYDGIINELLDANKVQPLSTPKTDEAHPLS